MDEIERTQLYHTAWKHWGAKKQMDMAIEEMAELTQAILKTRRNGVVFSYTVSEELADVLICLEQIESRLKAIPTSDKKGNWFDQVERIKEEKLQRLQSRLFNSLEKRYPNAGPQDGWRCSDD